MVQPDPAASAPLAPPPPPSTWRNAFTITLLLFFVAVLISLPVLEGSGRRLDYGANIVNFFRRFLQPDWSVGPRALEAFVETFRIAVMATFFSVIVSIPLSAAAAHNIAPRWVVWITRFALNVIRAIPSLIWAIIAVAVVGANPLAGVVALTFYSIGYLAKFFSEAFESVDIEVARALRAMGADRVQAFQFGLWPHAKPLIWSQSLWMLEYNIRSASIIGYVGAGGIGTLLATYQNFQQWDRCATVLLLLLAVVTLLDVLGQRIRAELTGRYGSAPPE